MIKQDLNAIMRIPGRNIRNIVLILFIILAGLQFESCRRNRLNVNLSGREVSPDFIRFDRLLFDKTINFRELYEKYPHFCNLFTYKVINIGGHDDEQFEMYLGKFLSDTLILNTRNKVEAVFGDGSRLQESIKSAFSHYHYYFPEKKIPQVFTFISGFNQSVVVDEGLIGIGLDKYLGRNCLYYYMLEIPGYKVSRMYRERIPVDVMYAWGSSEFEKKGSESTLLNQMIYEGKMLFFVDAMLPRLHDTLKIGYTGRQLSWCKKNEAGMWSALIEKKMLYTTKRMDIIRYTGEAPTTSGFPNESPGRTGNWIGWQIVRKYMEKNPEISLSRLMDNTDAQQILNLSGYYPD